MPPIDGTRRVAAIAATVGCSALFVFQALLSAGAPLGEAAFGGASVVLPPTLRMASAVSALLFLGAVWAVLSGAGVVRVGAGAVARRLLWCYVGLFGLSARSRILPR
jgi:hypothetical protein